MSRSVRMQTKTKTMTASRQTELRDVLRAAWNIPFYRAHWQAHSIASVDRAVEAFDAIPLIKKAHLRHSGPQIFRWEGAADVVSSSGTSGRPVDIPVLREEEANRIERVARVLRELDVNDRSRVLTLFTLNDQFPLGPQIWDAAKCGVRPSRSPKPAHGDRLVRSWRSERSDAGGSYLIGASSFRRDGPDSTTRWALWMRRSQTASATVGSPRYSW